jgi:hypothetical protein
MFELLFLLVLFAAGAVLVGVFAVLFAALKLTFHVALLPLKILFFPLIALLVLVKLAFLAVVGVAVVGIALAIIVPVALVLGILAAPFLLIGALT